MQGLVLHCQCLKELQRNSEKYHKKENKKHNKIVMLAITKLNSIESKISEALINNDEGFMAGNY